MSTQDRDTHFLGFAKLLKEDIQEAFAGEWQPDIQLLFAQRAYDLLVHDRLNTATVDLQHAASYSEAEELVNGVPDLAEWPKS